MCMVSLPDAFNIPRRCAACMIPSFIPLGLVSLLFYITIHISIPLTILRCEFALTSMDDLAVCDFLVAPAFLSQIILFLMNNSLVSAQHALGITFFSFDI